MSANIGFRLNRQKEIEFYTIPSFEETRIVKHGFTTRIGGASPHPFHSLNLGLNTEDNEENIVRNFETISDALEVPMDKMVLSDQVHGTNIRIITEDDGGKGLVKPMDFKEIDGLLTNVKGIMLFTFYADCVPLFFLDRAKKVAGVAHAGWKGTVAKIGEKMIKTMVSTYSSNPEDILVGIGPSIGTCCYSVKKDVHDQFNNNFINTIGIFSNQDIYTWQLDLWKANEIILKENGILSRNITISNLCTSCNTEKFFSYRNEQGNTGRMAAFIQLI
ncbi:conserved hypothetical protein [Proteiniborus ethanoligenes]|uniref:Purine nucleoside phosphorylase n=1 Tax=Proteiniborus ethanoligenes TaxID=415015 RepID=A0A1H3JY86_9FIRM|nr:peptidoglycan editing factor PgeF [Proteiniborus ethanoligenes]SDY44589.1 conserved hypothetical protein [Proteiniborus ethanoligenes]